MEHNPSGLKYGKEGDKKKNCTVVKPDKRYLKPGAQSDDIDRMYPWYDVMRMTLSHYVLSLKTLRPSLIWETALDKSNTPQLRHILQTTWPALHKNCQLDRKQGK